MDSQNQSEFGMEELIRIYDSDDENNNDPNDIAIHAIDQSGINPESSALSRGSNKSNEFNFDELVNDIAGNQADSKSNLMILHKSIEEFWQGNSKIFDNLSKKPLLLVFKTDTVAK